MEVEPLIQAFEMCFVWVDHLVVIQTLLSKVSVLVMEEVVCVFPPVTDITELGHKNFTVSCRDSHSFF